MSNLTIPRTQFDEVIDLADNPTVMPIFEKSEPGLAEFHINFDGYPLIADLKIGLNAAGDVDIAPRTGAEYLSRRQMAFYGFKPDRQFCRPGYHHSLRFSRVSDLESVTEVRGTSLVVDSRIQSHVVPYTFVTFTHGGGTADLNDLGFTANGLLLPFPWPRVLNQYRLVGEVDDVIRYPRGPVTGSTRGRHAVISDNGTMPFLASLDSAMSTNGEIILDAGDYRIEIGHVEPRPTVSVLGASMAFGPERWPSAATP